ncbi:Hemolysin, plasmid [Methylobacterium bullatum]|uniref:Hemolysin, plasmid n=1 Tax=Methylobacterium bullatum TaxID=570505 RepID=A0A679IK61_9HYPH|nr:Hemolysin, plasmid [Methylobacterium bullatum]
MLVTVGEPFKADDLYGYGFVSGVVPTAQGGYSILQNYQNYDWATGAVIQAQYVQTFNASGVAIGNPIKLGTTRVDNAHAVGDGSYLVSIDKSTQRFDDTGFHIDGKIALATMSASGKLTTFYTIGLFSVDGEDTSFGNGISILGNDYSIAYGKTGALALARIATSTTDGDNDRVVDIFDASHRFKATAIIDRSMDGDVQGSTHVTALSDGRYLATWAEADGTGVDVMARVITAAGKVSGAAFLLGHADDLATPADVHVKYATTALANGNFAFAFQASENYFDQTGQGKSEDIRNPVDSSIWIAGSKGFTHGPDLVRHTELSNPYFESMIALSNGKILQVVSDFQELGENVNLGSLHGYLYDENGKATGDEYEFYSDAVTANYFNDGGYPVALSNGQFAIVSYDYSYGPNGSDSQETVQVYSTTTANYFAVAGATAGDNLLKGASASARADLINGLDGNDKLYGYTGNDKLLGGNGSDLLDGGKGADAMEGGAGDDTYLVDNMGDTIVEGRNKGADLVKASVSYTADDNVDAILLTGSEDLRAFGNALANTITGNTGANVVYGLGGNDILNGGLNLDILNGGLGKDTFVFDTTLGPQNVDRIMDFVAADDTIKLDDAVFKGIANGTLKAALFKDITSSAIDKNDRILYDHNTGEIAYDADGSGAVKAVVFAILDTYPLLTASDFVIV